MSDRSAADARAEIAAQRACVRLAVHTCTGDTAGRVEALGLLGEAVRVGVDPRVIVTAIEWAFSRLPIDPSEPPEVLRDFLTYTYSAVADDERWQ